MSLPNDKVFKDVGTTEPTQVSAEDEKTSVQTDDSEIDLAKTYTLNKLTGQKFSGQELRTLVNQGILLRQTQSDYDKKQAELVKKEEAYKAEILRLETARQAALLAEANSRISKIENQKVAEDVDFDAFAPLEEEKPTMQFNPVAPVRQPIQVNPDEIEKRVLSKVDEILEKERQQRAQIEAVQAYSSAKLNARKMDMKQKYPVLNDDEISAIISSIDVATKNELEANNYIMTDMNKAFELDTEANRYRQRAIDLEATAKIKQEKYDLQQQRQKEIMTRSTAQQEKLVYSEKPVMNPAEEKQARENYRKIAEANAEQRRIMKASG